MNPTAPRRSIRGHDLACALIAAAGGAILLRCVPQLELEFFAQGAARLASVLLGTTVARVDVGWLLATTDLPVVVTTACSATDFYVIVAALVAWQFARRGRRWWSAPLLALGAAVPLAIGVNTLRVVAVVQAHRWVIPQFPDNYGPALHLLTGVAVFLPALVALNLVLELHGRIRSHSAAAG